MSAPTIDRPAADADPTWTRAAASKRLLAFGKPLLPVLAASTIFRIVQTLLGIALFAVAAAGVGDVFENGRSADIGNILLVMAVLAFAKGFIRYLEQFSGHYVAFHLLAMLRTYFYDRLEPQAPAGVERRRTGDLLARVTKDIDRVEVFYAHTIAPAITALVVPVIVLAYLAAAYDPLLALTLLPFLVGIGVVTPILSNRAAAAAATDLRAERGALAQHLSDSVQGVREVLAFGFTERRGRELDALGEQANTSLARIGRHMAARRGANEFLVAVGMVALLATGKALIDRGSISWADLAVVLAIALLTFGPVLGVEEFVGDLEQAFAGARRIWEITDAPPEVADPDQPTPTSAATAISLRNVTFSYRPDDPLTAPAVLDVSVDIAQGARVAIVGASGSGKSTLVSLLLRFWDPQQGQITIGGHALAAMSLDDLRSLVSVVSQRTYLFNDTIAANLRLAKPTASQDDIEGACRRAELHETIIAMPEGYATVVGEMGERLSGGQRQRLAIARALLKAAPILILDEATSNLDVHTEADLQHNLDDVASGRTVVIVAHRLSTITNADRIVVMDAGRIVEEGTHDELLLLGGHYAQLWQHQLGEL